MMAAALVMAACYEHNLNSGNMVHVVCMKPEHRWSHRNSAVVPRREMSLVHIYSEAMSRCQWVTKNWLGGGYVKNA